MISFGFLPALPILIAMLAFLALLFLPASILVQLLQIRAYRSDQQQHYQLPQHQLLIAYPAVSMGLIGMAYLWTTNFGMALTAPILRLVVLTMFVIALFLAWRARKALTLPNRLQASSIVFGLCFLGLLVVIIQTRWAHINQLAAPVWVDSLHHALLIRVAAERGQVPLSLEPYLPVDSLAYHWGLHVLSAAAISISGNIIPLQLPEVMLWQSFELQVGATLTCAGLALALWRSRLAALIALAIVGVGSIMPAFYLSWGRTTLLSGVVLLPGVMLLSYQLIRAPDWRRALLLACAMLGLSLTHLPTFVFALGWCLAAWSLTLWKNKPHKSIVSGLMFATSLIGAGLAQLPWLLLLLGRARPGTGSSALHVAGNSNYNAMPIGLLWAIGNDILLALAALAALVGIQRRRHVTILILLWCSLALLLANPVVIGLPYISFVTNEVLVVCLFIPATLLISGACSMLAEALERRWPHLGHVLQMVFAIMTIGWALWRAPAFQSVVNQDTIIATADDMAAVRWAASGTPANARFLTNTSGWLGPVDRGSDGGWWLLPVAGRQVSTPPVVYTYAPDAIVAQIQADTAWLRTAGEADDATIAAFMHQRGYNYVFATQHGTTLNTTRLASSALFEEVYANATVSILRLR